jgi:predicted aspartyl protease
MSATPPPPPPTGNPYFDPNGRPTLEIEVSNPLGWKRTVKALIDTGFDGFLSLPILEAFPIGLLLRGTMPVTLADGSTKQTLYCLGGIHFEGDYEVGVVLIETEGTPLIGMSFLRQFKRELVVDPASPKLALNRVP